MTRKKVKLTWIVSDNARKASLKKRRVGLVKKVSELTTLCGVNAFVLIYSPEEREPQMWPSRPVVEQLLARFNNMPEMEKSKKMINQETYLKERVAKVQDQLKKHERKNKEMEVLQVMEKLHEGKTIDAFNVNELNGLIWFSQEKKREIRKRIEYYQQIHPTSPESLPPTSLPPPPPPPQLPSPVEGTAGVRGINSREGSNPPDSGLWDKLFIDMMNKSEKTAGSSSVKPKIEAELPSYQVLAVSPGAANPMGFHHINPRDYIISSTIGMSHVNPSAHNIGSTMGIPQGNINIGTSSFLGGSNGGNYGIIHHPQGNAGEASNTTSSSMGLPSELFGGGINQNDIGFPYDYNKQWPGNFHP